VCCFSVLLSLCTYLCLPLVTLSLSLLLYLLLHISPSLLLSRPLSLSIHPPTHIMHSFCVLHTIQIGIRTSVLQNTVGPEYRIEERDYSQITKIFFKTKLKRSQTRNKKNKKKNSHLTKQYFLLTKLKTDFEFKDYGGRLFAHIRRKFGIDTHDYLHSLAGRLPYLDFVSNSKSGEFFFFTYDRKYMIKTQPPGESVFLRSFLMKYHHHLIRYPHTLLIKILGMHRVILNGKKQHFIVMENVFQTHRLQLSRRFDLKVRFVFLSCVCGLLLLLCVCSDLCVYITSVHACFGHILYIHNTDTHTQRSHDAYAHHTHTHTTI